ncbi:GntR family transcriptional regulator [Sphaerochaeta globosa]|uniref:Transcriptional regulator, GntR family n=1 Tax=Sphaerochaeta globosa (strain ATCC BAA-1886 / DSM 22777 / Buddy) TaxID=158189 RepID=F0RX67_SPHGB|nr:GntR family transcriptional regulator [Sphaerochaeta globosa]ADY11917.1 transcriptional regulator, GntR family [Sphaerochaeta globosa str. Buddy]
MDCTLLIPDSLRKTAVELNRFYAERVIEYNIVTLNLLPGQMVSEKDLAAQLEISKTPVHEALIELSKKSLTSIIPQVGTKIALIDIKKVEAVCFLRFAAEIEMLEKAFNNITPKGIQLLHRLIDQQMEDAKNLDYLQFLEDDNALHALLFSEAGLEEVGFLLEPSMPIFNRVRMLIYRNLDLPRIIREHTTLVACLQSRDLKGATEILHRHLTHDVVQDLNALKQKFPEYFLFASNKVY